MNRKTYVEIDLKNIKHNVKTIINKYKGFKYYFGVVKADCYGHGALECTDYIINGGVNYLVVALLEEALELRKKYTDIPILCLGLVSNKDLPIAKKNNITLTIMNKQYLDTIEIKKLKGIKVHIKINSGMNRLGASSTEEFDSIYELLTKNNIEVEGIYSHIHSSNNKKKTKKQFECFEKITQNINLDNIKIVHIQASDALVNYDKPKYLNGCRIGIIMYGLNEIYVPGLKPTFKVVSNVIQINKLKRGQTVGYGATYKAKKDELIAVVPIGYADGIVRRNKNRFVYIKNKRCKIVGNICMDMLFIKVDDSVRLFDEVVIIKDIDHINEISKKLNTIPYEILCSLSKRVPRVYKNK